jgi:hypothetical protein
LQIGTHVGYSWLKDVSNGYSRCHSLTKTGFCPLTNLHHDCYLSRISLVISINCSGFASGFFCNCIDLS